MALLNSLPSESLASQSCHIYLERRPLLEIVLSFFRLSFLTLPSLTADSKGKGYDSKFNRKATWLVLR